MKAFLLISELLAVVVAVVHGFAGEYAHAAYSMTCGVYLAVVGRDL